MTPPAAADTRALSARRTPARQIPGPLHAKSLRNVAEATPQAAALQVMEAEMPVERGGPVINSVDDHGPGAELPAALHAPAQRVHQEMPAQRVPCSPLSTARRASTTTGTGSGMPGRSRDGAPWCATAPIASA